MKSYTDLEQSKKLAEILPLESADMSYIGEDNTLAVDYLSAKKEFDTTKEVDIFPCWSLAALLGVLPKTFSYNNHTYQFMYNTHAMFYINVDNYDENTFYSTNEILVDACYEIILKLNKMNLL